jgi:HTH-type transcriptional regulator, competence development regulator
VPPKDRTEGDETQTLGEFLANVRTAKRLTLREVEEATEGEISNAYLSQLEHGRIVKPSPNVLHRLAAVYNVPYDRLMKKAGYLTAATGQPAGAKHGRVPTFAIENLTPQEEEALLEFLAFLRFRRGKSDETGRQHPSR